MTRLDRALGHIGVPHDFLQAAADEGAEAGATGDDVLMSAAFSTPSLSVSIEPFWKARANAKTRGGLSRYHGSRRLEMASQDLATLIAKLSPEERAAVEEFIHFLQDNQKKPKPAMTFQSALDSFVREHPELLRRLAQ